MLKWQNRILDTDLLTGYARAGVEREIDIFCYYIHLEQQI